MANNVDQGEKKILLPISSEIYEEIKQKILGGESGFSSIEDYVNYTLRVALGKKTEALSEEDTEAVTSRLKALGYI